MRRRQARSVPSGHPPAFTLIELLVVIAVVAILVALTLTGLSKAREVSRQTVCLSNLKQTVLAFHFYAGDYKVIPGAYWQGPINLEWSGRRNATYLANPNAYRHPLETSVLLEYLGKIDKIMECPAAKREANQFFDYTMIVRMAGARLDLSWQVSYPVNPASAASPRKNLPGIPLLMEEHDLFYNRSYDDGSFASFDQLSTRHGARATGSAGGGKSGGAHIAYLDGNVAHFKPPTGSDDRVEEPQDLNTRHLLVHKIRGQAYPIWDSNATEFGWINRTRN